MECELYSRQGCMDLGKPLRIQQKPAFSRRRIYQSSRPGKTGNGAVSAPRAHSHVPGYGEHFVGTAGPRTQTDLLVRATVRLASRGAHAEIRRPYGTSRRRTAEWSSREGYISNFTRRSGEPLD